MGEVRAGEPLRVQFGCQVDGVGSQRSLQSPQRDHPCEAPVLVVHDKAGRLGGIQEIADSSGRRDAAFHEERLCVHQFTHRQASEGGTVERRRRVARKTFWWETLLLLLLTASGVDGRDDEVGQAYGPEGGNEHAVVLGELKGEESGGEGDAAHPR